MGVLTRTASDNTLLSQIDARYRRALMSFFMRRVRDRSEAEDLTQRAFLRLMNAMQRGSVANTEAFLFTIASNLVHDHFRQRTRHSADTTVSVDADLVGSLMQEIVEDRSPERVLIGEETIVDTLRTLDELGERTRDIFILFRLEHMKQRDIADLYGISQSTVEKHVARATLHLALRRRSDLT